MVKLSEKQKQRGWQIVKFGEIAKNISQRIDPAETDLDVYVGLEHLDPQSLRIQRHGVPSDVKGQKLHVRPGQIIFGKRRAYQKKVAVADFDGICSAHAMVLEAIPGKIIPELLPFLMQSDMFMNRAVAISEGSLSPTIKWKTLAIQKFPLPPLERQKEILQLLEKITDCIQRCKELNQSLSLLKKSYINRNMPLNFTNQESYLLSELLKESKISGTTGKEAKKITIKLYGKGAVAKLDNLGSSSTKYFKRKEGQFVYSKLDFLNGAFAVIPKELDNYETTSDLPAFDVSEKLNAHWLFYYVTRETFYKNFINFAKGGRRAKRISPKDFLSTRIPKLPRKIQNLHVANIKKIRGLQHICGKKCEKLLKIRNNFLRGSQ